MKKIQLTHKDGGIILCDNINEAATLLKVAESKIRLALSTKLQRKKIVKDYTLHWVVVKPERSVIQYDFCGRIIKKYHNVNDAYGQSRIYKMYNLLKQKDRRAKGFFWSYAVIYIMEEEQNVIAINKKCEIVGMYNSINNAADDLCILNTEAFKAAMTTEPIDGIFIILLDSTVKQLIELDTDGNITNVYARLKDVVKQTGLTRNQICYSYLANNHIAANSRRYIRLESLIFANYHEQ